MKILIVDDEALARKRISKLITEAKVTDYIFEASSGKEAIQSILELKPDIIFLDIQMTDMTGFDVLKKIQTPYIPTIIFVTAFDHFAVKAFEVQAIDFLLKPFKKDRFFEALHRGINRIRLNEREAFASKINNLIQFLENEETSLLEKQHKYLERIVLKLGKKYYFVETKDVKHITSSAYYAEIYTYSGKKHIYRISMSDFIKKLDPKEFIRINRSTILRLKEIKEVITEGIGGYSITMNDGKSFSLTKTYKASFLKKIDIKNS
ncbi:LytTR family two component transcriptional regulator [Aquimarina sp. MAR_2010_214]|uniref:LytR/AlgR family response regulator transcription factor n=1 Tax=Aquimarina sp. MAR_2010_214 TaxID=1250026 RepID=UPI000C70FBE1|nr:LytTR family DNA-binding domain-containing protein [Aquimarina sp. MAR_2010_214]PKV50539.1 LytTR family two component transcriptional regulator [Aquimarina sp. MAR_2010_214]